MAITYHNIKGAEKPFGYYHATVAEGSRIVFISGQVGTDPNGALPEGLADQITNALVNVGRACTSAGAGVRDIAKVTFYVVNWDVALMPDLIAGTEKARETYDFTDVALTLISVNRLFTPEMLVEIEAVAVF